MNRIKARAIELLSDGTVARVIGWEKGETETDWSPALFETAEEMENFVYGDYAGANLSKYCRKFNTAEGKTLTADLLCSEYKKLNEQYFGPDMVVDDQIALEWARIPHFYYNYYVFQYATGYSAAIALSRRILKEGEPAVRDYIKFLSGGCSKSPIELLRDAGVDMESPEPVEQALQLFGELLDEMESLVEE